MNQMMPAVPTSWVWRSIHPRVHVAVCRMPQPGLECFQFPVKGTASCRPRSRLPPSLNGRGFVSDRFASDGGSRQPREPVGLSRGKNYSHPIDRVLSAAGAEVVASVAGAQHPPHVEERTYCPVSSIPAVGLIKVAAIPVFPTVDVSSAVSSRTGPSGTPECHCGRRSRCKKRRTCGDL
jgi:hypothetical protein